MYTLEVYEHAILPSQTVSTLYAYMYEEGEVHGHMHIATSQMWIEYRSTHYT